MVLTIIYFIFALLLFVLLVIGHEFGHFIMAKRSGIEVEEFGIGFPPRIGKGWKYKGTLYTFNLIPLGGFVRLSDEEGESNKKGSFAAAPLWNKTKVLLAGVVMNLIIAVIILFILCMTGIPGLGSQFEPGFLHPSYAQPRQLIITSVISGSPAASIGLKKNDYILSGNGQLFTTNQQIYDFTSKNAGKKVTFVVKENGSDTTKKVTLREHNSSGILGITDQQVYKLKYNPFEALVAAIYITCSLFIATIVAVFMLIVNIPGLIIGLFGSSVPVAAQNASGPVGIVYILTALGSLGLSYLFLFIANISVALAAFNVLPLPALDGGRLAVAYFRKISKRRISAESEGLYHMVGFILLIILVIIISIYDFRKF